MRRHLELVKAQLRQAGRCTFSPPKTTEAQLRHLPPRGVHARTARGSKALLEAGGKALVFAPENNRGSCLHMECARGHLQDPHQGRRGGTNPRNGLCLWLLLPSRSMLLRPPSLISFSNKIQFLRLPPHPPLSGPRRPAGPSGPAWPHCAGSRRHQSP
jgi:hypothetical protein